MTAVVGILNKSAVAIAADSAVSVRTNSGSKIFNRANKMFRLSKHTPIGLMIYNNGDFLGTPWETIIKQFCKEIATAKFESVEDCKKEFIQFLISKEYFCNKSNIARYINDLFQDSFLRIVNFGMNNVINGKDEDALFNSMASLISKFAEELKSNERCINFLDYDITRFLDDVGKETVLEAFKQTIGKFTRSYKVNLDHLVNLSKRDMFVNLLNEYAFLYVISKNHDLNYTGLIFAGFGDKEIFPQLVPVNVSVVIGDKLRYYDDDQNRAKISHENLSAIVPFAQRDVMDTILTGFDQKKLNFIIGQFENFMSKAVTGISSIVAAENPALGKQMAEFDVSSLSEAFGQTLSEDIHRLSIEPMLDAISTLSKEDLAEMAESLVYLTYLKRRFTFSEESVGGPVDVALITKGDGFVWLKRKHYFEPELNPHFINNY